MRVDDRSVLPAHPPRLRVLPDYRETSMNEVGMRWKWILETYLGLYPWIKLNNIEAALAGDLWAACDLICDTPTELRPSVSFAFHRALAPIAVRQAVFAAMWGCEDYYLLTAFPRCILKEMVSACGTRPADPPDRITIWRGGRGPLERLRRGWSWTTDRDIACRFATQGTLNAGRNDTLVVRATVLSSRIMHFDNYRGEAEVVLCGALGAQIDGDPEDWVVAGERAMQPTMVGAASEEPSILGIVVSGHVPGWERGIVPWFHDKIPLYPPTKDEQIEWLKLTKAVVQRARQHANDLAGSTPELLSPCPF